MVDYEQLCKDALDKMMETEDFMGPGRRNDDTVNLLIICKLLGFVDPDDIIEKMYNDGKLYLEDWNAYKDHARRITPYLEDWCASTPEQALWYCFLRYKYLEDICKALRENLY